MKKFDTILFDLDGTLIDTNEIIIKSYDYAFRTYLPKITVSRQSIIDQIGPPLKAIFAKYVETEESVENMITLYRDYYTTNEHHYHSIYPYVKEVISTLYEQGYNLGIVTSKFKVAAWPSFTHYGLDRYFKVFIALDDVIHPKPDKEPVLKALKQFDTFDKALMIGDNQSDILSGKNAGIKTAGVAWSIKGIKHLKEVNPDFMLMTMRDIYNIV